MKNQVARIWVAMLLLAVTASLLAQDTTITYQGLLNSGGGPANGNYDFVFVLYNDPNIGNQVGSALTNTAIAVSNGLFTVTNDFGSGPWTNQSLYPALWLQILVCTNGSGEVIPLSPRQLVTPSPYAIQSLNAATAATATSATSAATANNFSGSLNGDVTGTQSTTVVSSVGGQTAADVAGATTAANAATSAGTPNTIVQRDASGDFSAAAITAASISGDGSAVTNLNASQLASGTVADGLLSGNVALLNGANIFSGTNNFAGPVVVTNSANQFSGTFNGTVVGSASTASNFSGSLNGDVTGTQNSTVVSTVGGQSAASVASGTTTANAATSANAANAIVKRDASGNFNAGTITGNLAGNATTATTAATAASAATATIADSVSAANIVGPILNSSLPSNPNFSGTLTASSFSGDGGGLTNLNATQLSGTIPLAQLPTAVMTNNESIVTASVVADSILSDFINTTLGTNCDPFSYIPDNGLLNIGYNSGSPIFVANYVTQTNGTDASPAFNDQFSGISSFGGTNFAVFNYGLVEYSNNASWSNGAAPVVLQQVKFPVRSTLFSGQPFSNFACGKYHNGLWYVEAWTQVDINGFFTSSSNQLYVFDPVALTPVAHYPIGNEPSIPIDLDWIGTNAYMTFFAQTNTQPGMHTLFGYYTNTWALNGTNINLDANLNESGSLTYNPLDNHIYLMESDIDTDVSILKCDLGGHVTPVVFFPTDSEGSPASSFAGYGNLMFYPGNYTNIGFAFNYQGSGTGNGFTNQFEFVDISGSTPGLRVDYNGDVMANRISTTAIGLDATNSTSYFAGQNPADGVVGLDSGKNMYIWGHTTGSVYFGNPANGLLNYDAAISGGGSFWFGGPSSRPLELWNDGSRWVLSIKGRFGGNSVLSNADNILPGQSNTFIVNNNGGALTNLQGSAITGTITGNGSQLTSLNANNFSSGTLPSAQLSGAYSSAVTLNNTANSLTGSFSGNGAGLTNTTTAANYVFACDTTTQTISTANTFQAIAFGAINQINGWTYAGDVFDCNQSGLYLIQYDAEVETTASSAITTTLRAVLYGTNEIAGSESVVTMSVANQPFPVSKSFMVSASFGATLVFNIASTSTSAELAAGNASGTTNPSISCTIIRIQ